MDKIKSETQVIVQGLLDNFCTCFKALETEVLSRAVTLSQSQQHAFYDLWGRYLGVSHGLAQRHSLNESILLLLDLFAEFNNFMIRVNLSLSKSNQKLWLDSMKSLKSLPMAEARSKLIEELKLDSH